MTTTASPARRRGFSLIELMVAMAIGLVVVLAITGVMVRSEGVKRTSTNVNDVNQTGAYLSYWLDRNLRSAGSGYAQRWDDVFGCALNASRGGSVILPRASAMPAPFTAVGGNVGLAPVVIHQGQSDAGSDVLMVMAGTAGYSESPWRMQPHTVGDPYRLPNTLGIKANDLLLFAEKGRDCMVQQTNSSFTGGPTQDLDLAGTYYTATGTSVNINQFGNTNNTFVIPLGNAVTNPPQFQLIGVGNNATLFSYDLLRTDGGDTAMPIADSVFALRALYGVDSDADGKQDTFVDPGVSPYTQAELFSGTPDARKYLRSIVSVRIALVLRSPLVEKETVSPATLTLFSSLPSALQRSVALTGDDRKRRFRTVEFTVPLRNLMLAPTS